jgi:heme/copper-type cytochrome/quinol oxidase subunit 1
MSPLVRRFLKTAIAFLIVGIGLGVWMLIRRELLGAWPSPWWVSAHTHAILVGFVILMIFGVALWMFPRPAKDEPQFDPRFAEAAYWLIALGTAARVGCELARASTGAAAVRWAVVISGSAQAVGIALFFWAMWGRIRGRREESA